MFNARFKDRVAVITGAADGIGRAIAVRLAAEGAAVALFDLNEDKLKRTAGELDGSAGAVSYHRVDIGDEDSVADAVTAVAGRHGRIDIMINSAGIVGPTSTAITDYDTAAFDTVQRVNLRGSFLMLKHVLPHMQKRDYGRILLIASVAGKEGNPWMCGYSSSKAGVIGLAKGVAKECAETGIRINALAPTVIRTALVDSCTPEQVKYMTDKIPMKRCGELAEVAALSAWTVSDECSFTTGFTFDCTGGRATY